jgi:leucyl/phenylalanyl-tRNA--protein transferase
VGDAADGKRGLENQRKVSRQPAPSCYIVGVHDTTSTPPIVDPELLMLAYRSGIFPMADHRDDPEIFWVEPRRRAILPLDGFHLSHSLAKTLRRDRFAVTCNAAFADVMDACAAPRRGDDEGESESWISQRIAASYQRLHELGHAHSIECWHDGELVGGLYGVGFDGVFCGESMFSRMRDSSKVSLAWLVAALRCARAELLDCQFLTPHLESLGAVEITQKRYVALLQAAQAPYSGVGVGRGEAAGDADGAGLGLALGLGPGDGALDLPAGFAELLAAAAGESSSPGNFIAQLFTHTS